MINKKNDLVPEPAQPLESEWKFIDELRQPEFDRIDWVERDVQAGEVSLQEGVVVVAGFKDAAGVLDTAYADMNRFLEFAGIKENAAYQIITTCAEMEFEAYRIEITDSECRITAGDTEGIRRGIFYIQNQLLQAEGPFLTKGVIERNAVIKTRVSRCFFGPLKRPPKRKDELLDEINYYPDEYLNRLAHEGINGLWISISFKDLGKTDILPYDKRIEQRLAKLCQTIAQCRRYGIKIYLFCIEPLSFDDNDPILKKYPELGGTTIPGKVCFCPVSATAQTYLKTVMKNIFSGAPGLGGMILLSVGEWLTLCTNVRPGLNNCPHCSQAPAWKALELSLSAMEQGMREAAPEAELISWPYTQPPYIGMDKSVEAAAHLPDNVALMHNFESYGTKSQLGKEREITDYWLSYIGPSDFFRRCALETAKNGTKMFAKLQVGCSHEVATTQYVPVPGNLYKKYRAMHELGVSGVMQCWYFGAYPSLMTKAAGELAFAPFPATEAEFLLRLAKTFWGKDAPTVVKAWQCFSVAYNSYPLNNPLGYIGPMHDGIVWPLYLEPVNRRLIPSWQIDCPVPGDRIGECLSYGYGLKENEFTMDEVIILLENLCSKWDEGVAELNQLASKVRNDRAKMREIGVAQALGILFRSGLNIFRFYQLREELAVSRQKTVQQDILATMKQLVTDEINASRQMLNLTQYDSSLGFHSEAEGYKFHSEKLRWRINLLEELLTTEFPRIASRIERQLVPFPIYTGETPQGNIAEYNYFATMPEQKVWDALPINYLKFSGRFELTFAADHPITTFNLIADNSTNAYWRATYSKYSLIFNFIVKKSGKEEKFKIELETKRLHWHDELIITADGTVTINGIVDDNLVAVVQQTENSLDFKLAIPFATLKLPENFNAPIRINVVRIYADDKGTEITQSWVMPQPLKHVFVLGHHNPDDFGWLIPKHR